MVPSNDQLVWDSTICCGMVILLQLEFWGPEQNVIPNVWQLVFANVPIKGWVIHSYEYSLFYSSSEFL